MRGGVPCRCQWQTPPAVCAMDEINAASPRACASLPALRSSAQRRRGAGAGHLPAGLLQGQAAELYSRGYAAKFSQNSPNLLFRYQAHTGLGKTHLALAIADARWGRPRRTRALQAPWHWAAQLGGASTTAATLNSTTSGWPAARQAVIDLRLPILDDPTYRVHHAAADHQRAV